MNIPKQFQNNSKKFISNSNNANNIVKPNNNWNKNTTQNNSNNRSNQNNNNKRSNNYSYLKFWYTNVTSLDLTCSIKASESDIVMVSETWFKENLMVHVDGFSIYRKDRNTREGRVCLYVNKDSNRSNT
ncbi:unnamed protein product [Brachionus calyciflorus]|uniref:Uncharacterized protein n=1 Tax=Brachionus calyciflorus TaxID=104777 RepID=A0A813P7K0_9BILA|nr:unnamed protein product [Brachionus calyciflorus]